jgi:hypothetical protein
MERKDKEKDNGIKEPASTSDTVLGKLKDASEGLLYISETDAPFTPFFWPGEHEKLTPEVIRQHAKLKERPDVSVQTLDEFFELVAAEEEWMNDEEKAEARRFQNLQKTLEESLKNIEVFRFGETELDVFIVGSTVGGFAGLRTKVVET